MCRTGDGGQATAIGCWLLFTSYSSTAHKEFREAIFFTLLILVDVCMCVGRVFVTGVALLYPTFTFL